MRVGWWTTHRVSCAGTAAFDSDAEEEQARRQTDGEGSGTGVRGISSSALSFNFLSSLCAVLCFLFLQGA
jgi:hypothetical protein